MNILMPIAIGVLYTLLTSLFREPHRQNLNAIMIAGAGAAYLNGGLGVWEFAFAAVVTMLAYNGLKSYRWIGIGWVLHTVWDVTHHLFGTPIVPFVPSSSAGCAICDIVIALWCFAGAPSLSGLQARLMGRALRPAPSRRPCLRQSRSRLPPGVRFETDMLF